MGDVIRLGSVAAPADPSSLFADSECIADLILGGEDLLQRSVFRDDMWNLAGHRSWRDKAGSMTKLNFTQVSTKWLWPVKEFVLLQLSPSLALDRAPETPMAHAWSGIQEPITPTTAQGNLKMLSHALRIIDLHGIVNFDHEDWDRLIFLLIQPTDVVEKRAGATLSHATGRGRAQQLNALWQTSQIAGRPGLLGLDPPFGGRDTTALYSRRSKRNVVRPHESVGHMLGYTAWVFDHIAEDIVDHVEWWATHAIDEVPMNRQDLREALLELAGEIAERTGGALPGNRNINGGLTLAHAALGRLIGCFDADEAFLAGRWAMSQLKGAVTLSEEVTPCPLPVAQLPTQDGGTIPWTARLIASGDSLDIWQRRLVYCAMFYLSGTVMLRDSQLAVLSIDPLVTEQIARPDGTQYTKHTVRAYKTKNRHAPVPTTVTVNGRVAQIIQLMQRLQAVLGYAPARNPSTGEEFLFDQRLANPMGKTVRVDAREGLYLDVSFVKTMQAGARELNQRGVIAQNLEDAALNMRQVRITCAQAYAVREHGQALAAAFGQWDTSRVAAGYIGDVYRLITPLEPEETIDLVHEDIGRRLARAVHNRDALTGNGLARLDELIAADSRLSAEASRLSLSNPQPLSPSRLKTLGKHNRQIEQGPLTLCIYQPDGAMCGGKGKPDFRLCLPGQCRNSVMGPADRARYELMRRQHLALKSDVSRRAAEKMDDANPDIAVEFVASSDEALTSMITAHIADYIRSALEDLA